MSSRAQSRDLSIDRSIFPSIYMSRSLDFACGSTRDDKERGCGGTATGLRAPFSLCYIIFLSRRGCGEVQVGLRAPFSVCPKPTCTSPLLLLPVAIEKKCPPSELIKRRTRLRPLFIVIPAVSRTAVPGQNTVVIAAKLLRKPFRIVKLTVAYSLSLVMVVYQIPARPESPLPVRRHRKMRPLRMAVVPTRASAAFRTILVTHKRHWHRRIRRAVVHGRIFEHRKHQIVLHPEEIECLTRASYLDIAGHLAQFGTDRRVKYYEDRWLASANITRSHLLSYLADKSKHPHQQYVYMPMEEPTKRRMLNTNAGYLICQSSTLGWSPESESCSLCKFVNQCQIETQRKFPEIYRLRIEHGIKKCE